MSLTRCSSRLILIVKHMGTWGSGTFDSDDAYDVLDEFSACPTMRVIEDTLQSVLTPGYDGEEWDRALAAAELVAIIGGHPAAKRSTRHKEIMPLVRKQNLAVSPALVATAVQVCERALLQAEREGRTALYGQAEDYQAWIDAVQDLQKRLQEATYA